MGDIGLDFRLLGPLELVSDGQVVELGSPKQRAVLAMLVLHLNHVVPVDAIAEELWHGRPPASATKTVQSLIYRLRHTLAAPVVARAGGYALEGHPLQVDLHRFEQLVTQGRESATAGAHDAAATSFRSALSLWRGPAWSDLGDLARAEAGRLEEVRLAVTEELAEVELARSRNDEVVALLEPHVAAHPLRERAWGQLMVALYRSGRQAEALRTYQQLRTLLAEELGLEPTPALRALEGRVLAQELDAAAPPTPPSYPSRTPLIGRRSEIDELCSLLSRALTGSGRMVLVSGEPGIGKTRLTEELAAEAMRRRAAVFVGRCYEAEGTAPFTPFAEVLEAALAHSPDAFRTAMGNDAPEIGRLVPRLSRIFPDIGPPLHLDPEQQRRQLFQAVTDTLTRAARAVPLVLVLEDLHWADESTLLMLDHLSSLPALVLGTYRDSELNASLARALDGLIRRRAIHQIRLDPLTEPDVAEMLSALADHTPAPRVAAALYAHTQGNPFFVEEVFRHLVEEGRRLEEDGVEFRDLDVPANVRLVIGRRLDRLSSNTRQVLSVAAVAGRYFDYGLVARCAGDVVDALDEAERAHLVAPAAPRRFAFVHELVRQTLLTQLSSVRRSQLHLALADVLEDMLGGHPSDLAHHLLAATPLGDIQRTGRACLAAGDRALSALANAEAAEWYEAGLPFAPGALQIDLLTGLGEARRRSGHPLWRQTLLDASRQAAALPDAVRLARAVLANNRGITSMVGHVDDERLELLDTALELVGLDPTAGRADLLALLAVEVAFAGNHQRVLEAADEAASIAATVEDISVRARVGTRCLWACLVPDRFAAMAAEGPEVVSLADASRDQQLRVWSRVLCAWALLATGRLGEARRQTAAALAVADESAQPGLRCVASMAHAATIDALGDHDDAARLTQTGFDLGQEAGWGDVMAWYGARMWIHWTFEGQLEVAGAAVSMGREQMPQMITWQGACALDLGLTDQHEELVAVLANVPETLKKVPVDIFWVNTHFYFALAQGFGVHDKRAAAAIYDALLPHRSTHVSFGIGYWGPVEVGLAVAARAMGDPAAAIGHHEGAAATIDACGAARARALNGYQWAMTLLQRNAPGDLKAAVARLEDTLAYCEARGYRTFERKAHALLSEIL